MIPKEIFTPDTVGSVERVCDDDGVEFDVIDSVDCKGLRCPRPQLVTKRALKAVPHGDVIKILVDSEASTEGIEQMLSYLSATLLKMDAKDGVWSMYIRRD